MVPKLLQSLSSFQLGILAILLGFMILFGAFGKEFFHVFMIVAGILLMIWGFDQIKIHNLMNKLK